MPESLIWMRQTTNKSNLTFAIDNGTTVIAEALRLNSAGNAVFGGDRQ